MTVTNLWCNGKMHTVGVPSEEEKEHAFDLSVCGVMQMIYISVLCSRAVRRISFANCKC